MTDFAPEIDQLVKRQLITAEEQKTPSRLKNKLTGFIAEVDSKKEFDMVSVLKMYKEWYKQNNKIFEEEEDDSVALIEDFISLCGRVESARTSGKDTKANEFRDASIEIQRQIMSDAMNSISFDESGKLVIINTALYNRTLDLMTFLTDLTDKVVQIGGNPKEFEGLTFLSGIRSMVYAECLASASGATISFDSIELDRDFDVDFLASKEGVVIAVGVGTIRGRDIPTSGYVQTIQKSQETNIPPDAIVKLHIQRKMNIEVPSAKYNQQFYSNVKWGRALGIPAQSVINDFKIIFEGVAVAGS